MKIGIDIDEVVVEFIEGFLSYYNSKFDKSFKKEDIYVYDFWKSLGIGEEESISLVLDFYESPGFENLELVEGIKKYLPILFEGNEIFFITSRPESTKDKTIKYFQDIFPDSNHDFLFSGDFHGDNKTKQELCKDFGIDIMIEDNSQYALGCAKEGVRTFLIDKPWNHEYPEHDNLTKVNNWEEIIGILKGEEAI